MLCNMRRDAHSQGCDTMRRRPRVFIFAFGCEEFHNGVRTIVAIRLQALVGVRTSHGGTVDRRQLRIAFLKGRTVLKLLQSVWKLARLDSDRFQ